MTPTREARRVVAAWADPELWPPKGRGCWGCHVAPPVVRLAHTALCFDCLGRWFPNLGDDALAGWLIRQAESAAAWVQGREARKERDKAALKEWLRA